MKYFLGFDAEAAGRLSLYTEELYVLDWFLQFRETGLMEQSAQYPGYYLVVASKVQTDLPALKNNSLRNIATIFKRLCGEGVETPSVNMYPLSRMLLVEHGFRNTYFKVNMEALKHLKKKTMEFDALELDDEFYSQYKQISSIHNFKHKYSKTSHILILAQQYIRNILDGSFLERMQWDGDWLDKYNLKSLENPTFELILQTLSKYHEATQKGEWLDGHRCSLATFFYNPTTKHSMFIHFLGRKMKISLPDADMEIFTKSLQKYADRLHLDKEEIAYPLSTVYTFWKEDFSRLYDIQSISRKSYWRSCFGNFPDWGNFTSYYIEYLETLGSVTKWDLGIKGNRWYGFVRYMYLNYNKVRLSASDGFFKKLEEGGE